MISAPIVPRTRQSLWDLLESEPERLERGFTLVQRELIVSEGIVVEGLGRDTSGKLVLVFLCAEEGDDLCVAQRVFAIDQWVRRNDRLLLSVLADSGVRSVTPPRAVVLGFDFNESAVSALRSMPLEDLAILRCEAFILDGQLHAGLSPVLGQAASGHYDTMTLPAGIGDDRLRAVGEDLLDVMRRLAPNIQVQGDRFSRRFSSEHGHLAELYIDGDRLYFHGVGDSMPTLVTDARSREIKDSIVRSYRDQLSQPNTRSLFGGGAREPLADRVAEVERESAERRDGGRSGNRASARDDRSGGGGRDVSTRGSDGERLDRAPQSGGVQERQAPVDGASRESSRGQDGVDPSTRTDHALHPLPRTPVLGEATLSQEEFNAFDGMSSESQET